MILIILTLIFYILIYIYIIYSLNLIKDTYLLKLFYITKMSDIYVRIYNTAIYGFLGQNSEFYDDSKTFGEKELNNYKITKIKIYVGYLYGKKEILGIGYTHKNMINGEEINTIDKNDIETEEILELTIKGNDYLFEIELQFDNFTFFLRFKTKKNHQIFFGEYNKDFALHHLVQEKNQIIWGFYGAYRNTLDSIGCYYYRRLDGFIKFFYIFFALKYKAKSLDFRNKWETKYRELPISYQFIWRTITLPDDCKYVFHSIIKYIFYF